MPRSRRLPPPIDAADIDVAARTYLTRYFTSRAHLRRLLMRRVDKSIAANGGDRTALAASVDATLDHLVEVGALNDEVYARDKVRSLVRRGVSEAVVHQRLASRGLGGDRVRAGLEAVRESGADPAMSAVCAFVRRRRLGPYRIDADVRVAQRARDLAALGRAGFSYAIARRALDMETVEEVESLLLR
ncbi:MAG: RecX family transcriptional regulator [Pseudomonadota bacterium]|nr:RecX family transcriptional regulator [Pseudomonadota bacterium]